MNFRKTLLPLLLLLVCITRADAQMYMFWTDGHVIATDYNTCLQGVKDSAGTWVIPPQYEFIERDYDRYIVSAGGKYGLLNRKGKVMIPVQYDYLRACNTWLSTELHDYYTVTLNDKTGIADTANRIIVPIRYTRVIAHYDTSFVARKSKRTYDFYNAQGTCFPCPWKSRMFPDHDAAHLYIMQKRLFRNRHGLVNDSGRIVFQRKYNNITAYDETGIIRIVKKGKYGFCSKAGTEIWPMVFSSPDDDWEASEWNRLVGMQGTGPVRLNGKYGLITAKGDTVLPFIYDQIFPFANDAPELWQVIVGQLSGIYDSKSRSWLLQPACTEITNVASYRNEKDSSAVALLVAKMNDRWGAMTSSGQVVIPFECEEMLWRTNGQHIFLKGDSVLALSITTLEQVFSLSHLIDPQQSNWAFWFEDSFSPAHTMIPANNRFSVFKGKEGVRCYYLPSFTKDSVLVDSTMRSASTGNYYGMKIPDSVFIASCFSVIPLTKPLLDYEHVDFYDFPEICDTDSSDHYISFCLIRKKNRSNLTAFSSQWGPYYITNESDVLKEDGTVLISGDTIVRVQVEQHLNDGSVYFRVEKEEGGNCAVDSNGKIVHPIIKKGIEEFSGNYTWVSAYDKKNKNSCYQIIDNRTGLPVLGDKMYSEEVYPIWDSITIVNSQQHGVRIYNLNQRKYCSISGYGEIVPLRSDGTLFGVKTCVNNIGVVDASGKIILDTIYTALTCVDKDKELFFSGSLRSEFFRTFYTSIVFYNATQAILLDPAHKKLVPYSEAVPLLWQHAVYTDYKKSDTSAPSDSVDSFFSNNPFVSICMTAKDSALMQPWQMRCMIDSVYTIKRDESAVVHWNYHRCLYCYKRGGSFTGGPWTMYKPEKVRYQLSHRSDSLLCFSRVLPYYYGYYGQNKNTFSTAMLFKDGPHVLQLDSLFNPTSDWRNFIINALITYVNTHQNIEGDCHNPAGIPEMLKNDFEITPNGLSLYPHGFVEKGTQLVLHISWKELDPYLRNDLRSRLPLNQQ